ncbi:TPA: ParB N-terminal domain-containing protein [Escherichia coli]|nr:ParB N-terminal domain-containing protein [Escherichia coli]
MYCIKNMDVKITILQVEVANLRPNPWNTNSVGAQNFEKLKGSIEKLGFFKPILARELDGGIFEILGGEHRWRAAMEQGISTVPVISVGKINDLVAKQMSLADTIKTIIKEQGINTGNEMENAGEALVWLVDYYKERM